MSPAATNAPRDGHIEVFGHRGACGYRPEHTLASYELAARLGADHIEPDLVSTQDGVLVSRHENEIGTTTDVAAHPEFAGRKTTKTVDGTTRDGWFTEDFTLAELRTLRARERIPQLRPDNTAYDGMFAIPTLTEILKLAERLSRELDRPIGVAPETKHPSYFEELGLPLEPPLIDALERHGLNRPSAAIAVQSFEVDNLRRLRTASRARLVQLIGSNQSPRDRLVAGDRRTGRDLATPAALREIAEYADVLAPDLELVLPRDDNGRLTRPTTVVSAAHDEGLDVLPYTVRAENAFLPADFRVSSAPSEHGDVVGFCEALFVTGVDALFSDHPDAAILARERHRGIPRDRGCTANTERPANTAEQSVQHRRR